jgi:hypothetical protein
MSHACITEVLLRTIEQGGSLLFCNQVVIAVQVAVNYSTLVINFPFRQCSTSHSCCDTNINAQPSPSVDIRTQNVTERRLATFYIFRLTVGLERKGSVNFRSVR